MAPKGKRKDNNEIISDSEIPAKILRCLRMFCQEILKYIVVNFETMDMIIMNKKTTGRRKIEMKKIEKKPYLQVAFSKRRPSLFKKAADLNVLTGAEVAVIAMSPGGKIYAFGSPSVENLIQRFGSTIPNCNNQIISNDRLQKLIELEKELQAEKDALEKSCFNGTYWWENDMNMIESLSELEKFTTAMEVLHSNVTERVHNMEGNEMEQFLQNFLAENNCSSPTF